jgi:hypothetical protein
MSLRGWGGSVATAIGVAAVASAAQLGFGYGLGIIAWLSSAGTATANEAAWAASLVWSVWIAATSTVAGAIGADRLIGRRSAGNPARIGASASMLATNLRRVALAVAAAAGGLVTVALVAVPTHTPPSTDPRSPQTIAAWYAVVGVLIGLLMAICAFSSPAVASNIIATVCWLWSLAVVAVAHSVASRRDPPGAQLGVWQITSDSNRFWFHDVYWPGAALSLGSALLIGFFVARPMARRVESRVGTAASGAMGPILVAAAYVLAATRLDTRAEESAHLIAPWAVIAGLAGSVLATAIAQRSEATARLAPPPSGGPDSSGPDGTTQATPSTGPDVRATTAPLVPDQRSAEASDQDRPTGENGAAVDHAVAAQKAAPHTRGSGDEAATPNDAVDLNDAVGTKRTVAEGGPISGDGTSGGGPRKAR